MMQQSSSLSFCSLHTAVVLSSVYFSFIRSRACVTEQQQHGRLSLLNRSCCCLFVCFFSFLDGDFFLSGGRGGGKQVGVLGNGKDGASGSPWLSVLNVLSGGVFVAAGFMHLLPEAEEGLAALSSEWKFQVGA